VRRRRATAFFDVAGHLAELHHTPFIVPSVVATSSAVCSAMSFRSRCPVLAGGANSRGALPA